MPTMRGISEVKAMSCLGQKMIERPSYQHALVGMVPRIGFEPMTYRLGGGRSIP